MLHSTGYRIRELQIACLARPPWRRQPVDCLHGIGSLHSTLQAAPALRHRSPAATAAGGGGCVPALFRRHRPTVAYLAPPSVATALQQYKAVSVRAPLTGAGMQLCVPCGGPDGAPLALPPYSQVCAQTSVCPLAFFEPPTMHLSMKPRAPCWPSANASCVPAFGSPMRGFFLNCFTAHAKSA